MKEPFVIVRERYINNPTTLAVDSSCSIGGVLPVDAPNKEVSYYKGGVFLISSPKQFRDAFCGGNIPIGGDGGSDSLIINAYYMSFFASLVIRTYVDTPPTDPGPDASQDEKNEYQKLLSKYNTRKTIAIGELIDNEAYPFRYIATFGSTDTSLLSEISNVTSSADPNTVTDQDALAGFDASYSQIIRYHTFSVFDNKPGSDGAYGNNFKSNHNILLIAELPDRRTGFLLDKNSKDATVEIAASTLYWERLMVNRSQNNEFAPMFGKQYGQLNYTNPDPDGILSRSKREELLGNCIDSVKYDLRSGSYYLNDNWTAGAKKQGSGGDNNMDTEAYAEENLVRFAHYISNTIQDMLDQFKTRQNSSKTRKDVTDMLNLYFDNYVMTQGFPPEEYMVICDETNNDDAVVRSRKLCVETKVRLYNSIKYITIVNSIYVSGGAEFTE